MSVIDTLVDEHRLVRKYLDTLKVAVYLMRDGGKLPKDFFDKTLDFSKTFLDTYHHFKEEYILFLKLAEKRGAIDAQVVSLRDQHESGRNFVKKITASIDGYLEGSEVQRAKLIENLGYFYELQRQHLNRENHTFFPMAREAFSDAELEEFAVEFKKEEERLGPEILDYSAKLVDQMSTQLSELFGEKYTERVEFLAKTRSH